MGQYSEFSYIDELTVEDSEQYVFPQRIETGELLLYPIWDFSVVERKRVIDVFTDNIGTDEYFGSGFGNPRSAEEFDEWIETIREKAVDETDMFYGIVEKSSGEFLGHASIEHVEWKKRRCEIGVWLKESVWGGGLSQHRAEALLATIFEVLELEIAEVLVAKENTKCIRAVEKYVSEFSGSRDGVRRNAGISPYGPVLDVVYYSISASEFADSH